MERSEHDVRGTSRRKRRRRRRSEVKGSSRETCPKHGSRSARTTRPLLHQSQSAAWTVTQKNAVVQLNELRPGLSYDTTSKAGPLHAPVFSVSVDVDGFHFEGRGPTKKRAKMKAAESALRSFIQVPNASQVHAVVGNFSSWTDFTAETLDVLKDSEPENCPLVHCKSSQEDSLFSFSKHERLAHVSLLENLSPVVLLNQLRPGLRFRCLAETVHGRWTRSFVMVVETEGRVFEGCGRSKKTAKVRAAAAALKTLGDVSLGPERTILRLQDSRDKNHLPQSFSECVHHLLRDKYAELTAGRFSASHTVLAGIVMTTGFDLRSAQVVSLATGTKCLDVASDRDWTLSDGHAEVLSRKSLLRFFYSELETLLSKTSDHQGRSIFVPSKDGGLRLRDSVLFHMYTDSSPCGDARVNCPYESVTACETQTLKTALQESETLEDNFPLEDSSRRLRCGLRVKVSGEGTRPASPRRAANHKAAVTMSCTDKMAKWSVVGLQGALLSHLVEPVYLHSLTVATLSHTGHLDRALTRRLAAVKRLPFPYRGQRLLLSCLSSSDVRPTGKPSDVSVNWSCGDQVLEETSASTGRRKNCGTASRLCRNSLFTRWQRLQQQISGADATVDTYSGSKTSARRYQRALQQFIAALQAGGLGTWLRKSPQPE